MADIVAEQDAGVAPDMRISAPMEYVPVLNMGCKLADRFRVRSLTGRIETCSSSSPLCGSLPKLAAALRFANEVRARSVLGELHEAA